MTHVHQLTFGPFAENTYIVSDDDGNALIIDPGMYDSVENARFFEYVNAQNLKPIQLVLTHAHLDHVFGINWVHQQYGLTPILHQADKFIYDNAANVTRQYGLKMDDLIEADLGLEDGTVLEFGETIFDILHAPGHSPGSVCFYNRKEEYVIAGDVLFEGSIGRTDLPGGDFDTLIRSIKSQLMVMSDDVLVYSGHGPLTTIGQERISNPYLQA